MLLCSIDNLWEERSFFTIKGRKNTKWENADRIYNSRKVQIMRYTIYDYGMFFFFYSFLGWVLEEVFAAFKYGKFINRGFVNGPICPIYGISMMIVTNNLQDLVQYPFFQFVAAVMTITVIEYMAGAMMFRITGKRLWDYSNKKRNLNGYICLDYSIFWGACAVCAFWLLHPFIYMVNQWVPYVVKNILLLVLGSLFLVDLLVTITVVFRWKRSIAQNVAKQLFKAKSKLGEAIFLKIQTRMYRSFPELSKEIPSEKHGFGVVEKRTFAKGLCFEKLFWVFFVSALLGDWIETAFMWFTTGKLMSRSSLLYGTFSIVWGLGGAAATGLLYSLRNKNDRYIFVGGFLLGGVYEYSCSVFTEIVFGTVFWDYSKIPFNLNGRVNLLFCFFWGILAIVWIKLLYPALSKPIEKIPILTGKILTGGVVIFMILNMLISSLAIYRYVQRNNGMVKGTAMEQFMDYTYPDSLIERIYPNMKIRNKK